MMTVPTKSRRIFLGDYRPSSELLRLLNVADGSSSNNKNGARDLPLPSDGSRSKSVGTTLSDRPIQQPPVFFATAPLPLAAIWFLAESRADVFGPMFARWVESRSGRLQLGYQVLDLSDFLVVLPTSQSRQIFARTLSSLAAELRVDLVPPEYVSLASLPEYLYDNDQPFANPLEQRLTWISAIEHLEDQDLDFLLPGYKRGDPLRLLDIAQQIQALHERLATEVMSFASVRKRVEGDPQFLDIRRWRILDQVQSHYYAKLLELGYWDLQAARNAAIRRGLCRIDRPIVLVGTADLNPATKSMLHAVSPWVTALVMAPESLMAGFDAWGSLNPDFWRDWRIGVTDEQIKIVDRPLDQAVMAAQQIENWQRESLELGTAASAIAVGVPDAEVEPALLRVFGAKQWVTRASHERSVGETLPGKLLTLVAQFLSEPRFQNFAMLVRHPDCHDYISFEMQSEDWLSAVDQFQNEHLPWDIPIKSWTLVSESAIDQTVLAVHRALLVWLKPLLKLQQTLPKWGEAIQRFLQSCYGDRIVSTESEVELELTSATQALFSAAVDLEQLPTLWKFSVSLSDVLPLLLSMSETGNYRATQLHGRVELVGWLDLALSPAAYKIITGVNNEVVPSPEPSHPYLPQSLRNKLGILDDDRRLVRDTFALELVRQSTPHLLLIAGRRNRSGDPLRMSRLLLNADDSSLVRRSQAFFSHQGTPTPEVWLSSKSEFAARQTQPIPQPLDVKSIQSLSVTHFREYLKCPYRYYLKCILGLQTMSDQAKELDGGAFGALAHDVFEAFGKSKFRNSTDPEEIGRYLSAELDRRRRALPVREKVPAVKIQLENLRLRLQTFAEVQAKQAQEGWKIIAVENKVKLPWKIGEQTFEIVGKIDRIDQHEDGRFAVWDYKTSDSATKVQEAHRRGDEWIDLQLPLYRHLLVHAFPAANEHFDSIVTGYILLPKRLKDVQFNLATWNVNELAESDRLAESIMNQIMEQKFWPPNSEVPEFSEELAAICQDTAMQKFEWAATAGDLP